MNFAAVGNKVSHIYSTLHRVLVLAIDCQRSVRYFTKAPRSNHYFSRQFVNGNTSSPSHRSVTADNLPKRVLEESRLFASKTTKKEDPPPTGTLK